MSDIKSLTLTFAECRRPWESWGIRQTLGSVNPAWGNCSPADIDGVLELSGNVLFIEDKDFGTENPTETASAFRDHILAGQRRTFDTLCRPSNQVVLVVDGPRDRPRSAIWWRTKEIVVFHGEDRERQTQLIEQIGRWARHVAHRSSR